MHVAAIGLGYVGLPLAAADIRNRCRNVELPDGLRLLPL